VHHCVTLTCRAVCRRVDIVASFKLRIANARLAFLRPNSRNLAFFKVVWHEKMVFGMYVIVWHFLACFDGVGMKKHRLGIKSFF